jgi:hypothetical protein
VTFEESHRFRVQSLLNSDWHAARGEDGEHSPPLITPVLIHAYDCLVEARRASVADIVNAKAEQFPSHDALNRAV